MGRKSSYLPYDEFVNTIIGEGSRVRGELFGVKVLRIDGSFSGSIKTTGKVLIGKLGRAECSIVAKTVVIGGVFDGDITASERVKALSTSKVCGSVVAKRFVAEEGSCINCRFSVRDE